MIHSCLLAALLVGCETYVATDGHAYVRSPSHSVVDPWHEALVASAAHDLECDRSALRVVADYREQGGIVHDTTGPNVLGLRGDCSLCSVPPLAAVEGCGQRVTYTVADDHLVITNRVVLR